MTGQVIFENVWKKFRRSSTRRAEQFWALEDVSFAVQPAEALGVIGPNGAGKSTCLKLLTKILRPTRGSYVIKGRVGALIEVAAGFHPDLTGRENVYLQGAIMGMTRADITRKLDDIVDFSGLNEFVDMPVKRYSSGMNARLGFSIAANLDPDVLLIDEVLAVGDMAFQQRCIQRMHEFKRRGVAIVFVSHNLQAVTSLCDRALFLSRTVQAVGAPADVIRAYVTSATSGASVSTAADKIRIAEAELLDEAGNPAKVMVPPGTRLVFRAQCMPEVAVDSVTVEFLVYRSTDNLLVYERRFSNEDLGLRPIAAGEPFDVRLAFDANLTRSHYRVAMRIFDNGRHQFVSQRCPPIIFGIEELQTWDGVAHLAVKPAVRSVSAK